MGGEPPLLFLSHATADQPFIDEHILPVLEATPYRIFYAKSGIRAGDEWRTKIFEALDEASMFVVVVSRSALGRDRYVRAEVGYWLDEHPDRAGLVPVVIDDAQPRRLELKLGEIQAIRIQGPDPVAQAKLATALRSQAPAAPVQQTRPVPLDSLLTATRAAYLRWLRATHQWAEASISDTRVRAPLADAPPSGRLYSDGSTRFSRVVEVAHLRSQATGARGPAGEAREQAVLADRPLPTYLASTGHIDHLDVTAREGLDGRRLLSSTWRSVVLGDPGSGKSTLARQLALDLADRLRSESGDGDRWRLPVLCRATDLSAVLEQPAEGPGGVPGPPDLAHASITAGWDAVPPTDPHSGDPIPADALARLVQHYAERRELLLIVDGLDEVPTLEARRAMVDQLSAYADRGGARLDRPDRAPGNQLVVTSRLVGYHAAALSERFEQFLLGPLEPASVHAIGEYWLRAYSDTAGYGPAAAQALLGELGARLGDRSSRFTEIVTNPYLLVSLTSAIASGSISRRRGGGRWRRGDLYLAMTDDAITRGVRRFPDLTGTFLLDLQCAVAYQMHSHSRTGVLDRNRLRESTAAALDDLRAGDLGAPLPVERALTALDGLGLITERGQRLFGFLHLTVEEYLAGRWLVREGDPAERILAHLGDPRWVEAIRLGLGHLGSTAPEVFDRTVSGLLTGPQQAAALELLSSALSDLGPISAAHLEAIVAVTLSLAAREIGPPAGPPDALSTAATVLSPFLTANQDIARGRAASIVSHRIEAALKDTSPVVVDAAALLVDRLRLAGRGLAQALFDAQHGDSVQRGWHTVRALNGMQARWGGSGGPGGRTAAAAAVGALSGHDREVLAALELSVPPGAPSAATSIRGLLPGRAIPMREGLDRRPEQLKRALEDPCWARLLLCLYGGLPLREGAGWRLEARRLGEEFDSGNLPEAQRRQVAVRLDTVVMPALQQAEQPVAFATEYILVDSPLSVELLRRLDANAPVGEVAAWLRRTAGSADQPAAARGDALAGWLMIAGEAADGHDWRRLLDAPSAERLTWRLGRARLLLADAAHALNPAALAGALRAEQQPFTMAMLGMAGVLADPGSEEMPAVELTADQVERLPDLLVDLAAENSVQSRHQAAVLLDTAVSGADPAAIAQAFARAHLRAVPGGHWPLDPQAPAVGRALTEALTNLILLPPSWAFLRTRLITRLAAELTQAGLGVEAMCALARVPAADPATAARAAEMLAGVLGSVAGVAVSDRTALTDGTLARIAAMTLDPYTRGRARVALAAARGRTLAAEQLLEWVAAVPDPEEGVRLAELGLSLHVVHRDASLVDVVAATAERITDADERSRAQARVRRLRQADAFEALTLAAVALTGVRKYQGPVEGHVRAALVELVCAEAAGMEGDHGYNTSVVLDTAGAAILAADGAGLARALAGAHLSAVGGGEHWWLDAAGPVAGAVLAEALTNLGLIGRRGALLFGWALNRLAPALVRSGYGVEAVCVALRGPFADEAAMVGTVAWLLRELDITVEQGMSTPADWRTHLAGRLDQAARNVADPYPRARALLHVAALRGERHHDLASLRALADPLDDAEDRIRLVELALALQPAAPDAGVLGWLTELARALPGSERQRALARLHQFTEVVKPGAGDPEPFTGSPAPAEAGLAGPVLAAERLVAGQVVHSLDWSVLSAGARCLDAQAVLDAQRADAPTTSATAWRRLADPALRRESARVLLRDGELRAYPVGQAVATALARLLSAGEAELVADLLRVCQPGTGIRAVSAWRRLRGESPQHRRVADLATLLFIESRRLDPAAVEALPRLLGDPDDRIRLRTALALSSVSSGRAGGEPWFTASALGATTLAALLRLHQRVADTEPRLTVELSWMVDDVVHDSPAVLTEVLDELADEPKARLTLLRSLFRLTPATLPTLEPLLYSLPSEEQCAVIQSLQSVAGLPGRYGMDDSQVAGLVPLIRRLAADADDDVFAETLVLLGQLLPPDAESAAVLVDEISLARSTAGGEAAVEYGCHGLGLLLVRAPHLLGDESVTGLLWSLAAEPDQDVAAAAVSALVRAGQDMELATGLVEPAAVLRGLLSGADTLLYGEVYFEAIGRAARFVTHPPALAEADAVRHTTELTEALLGWVRAAAADRDRVPHTLYDSKQMHLLVSVLAELAAAQPAALREAVEQGHRDLPRLLISMLETDTTWLVRYGAGRLLAYLGRGDGDSVRAMLAVSADTGIVRTALLRSLGWCDRIDPEGVAVLVEALGDPRLSRAHLAVEMLTALAGNGVLDAGHRRRAAEALSGAAERPDAYRWLLHEAGGRIVAERPFGEAIRDAARRLGGDRPLVRADAPVVHIGFTWEDRRVAWTAPAGRPADNPFGYQGRVTTEVDRLPSPAGMLGALERAAGAARQAGASFGEVLARVCAEPPGQG